MIDHPYVNLVAACILAVPAILSFIQGIKNGRKAEKVEAKVDTVQGQASAVQATVDSVVKKTDEIHGLVNSAMSAVKADLALANQRIATLQELVNTLTSERAARDAAIQAVKDAPRS